MYELRDSRRLTGPNLFQEGPGAVIEAACPDEARAQLVEIWRAEARRLLDAVGWTAERLAHRLHPGGASLALSAPLDGLCAAAELNSAAFAAARARAAASPPPDAEAAAARLRSLIEAERSPALMTLRSAALEHRVAFMADDERVSVGMGRGSRTWPIEAIPDPSVLNWTTIHDIPVALVTGTNGKTTTVRLIGAIAVQAGRVAGMTSTDGIDIGGQRIGSGDSSGPEGARAVLRDRRVDVAVLETARAGMLHRGLAVARASASLVTNIADDHLLGPDAPDPKTLAEARLIVRRAVGREGLLVLNADDEELGARGGALEAPLAWFTAGPQLEAVKRHVAARGSGAFVDDGRLFISRGGTTANLLRAADLPVALGGAALHNISNALGAALVASALGLEARAIIAGLHAFRSDMSHNPGRGNLVQLGGVKVIVDSAHNPHGFRALLAMAANIPAERRLILLVRPGEGNDAALRAVAEAAWKARPDRMVLEETPSLHGGRGSGGVPGTIESELRRLGAGDAIIERAGSELEGARAALGWARPGDLLLLASTADREAVVDLVKRLRDRRWQPGQELP